MCRLVFRAVVTFLFLIAAVEDASGANPLDIAMITLKGEKLEEKHYCVSYVPAIKGIKKEQEAVFRPLVSLVNDSVCEYEKRGLEGKAVLIERCSNDTSDEIVMKLKSAKASAALILFTSKHQANETETKLTKVDISVAFVVNKTGYEIAKYDSDHNSTLYVKLFSRPALFDWSFAVIWLLAVFTVVCGSFWSGVVQHAEYQPRTKSKGKKKSRTAGNPPQHASDVDIHQRKAVDVTVGVPQENLEFAETLHDMDEGISAPPISTKIIIMFVVHMCVMLLMLYYFFRYLVYVIMFMFAMASSAALVACLEPLVRRINIGTRRVPKTLAFCCQTPMEVREVVLLCMSFSVGITWIIMRHHEYAWVLQDLLGIVFCINMLKGIHLPNLKVLSLLLMLLSVYDVFFVFITPFLSANRESVMVEVAKGGSSTEQLPMVIKFPKLSKNKFELCIPMKFSILGLGDILAPAYGVGMVMTFCALHLMQNAQPALLYLVPCTITPTILIAWYRGHLYSIWNGVRLSSSAAPATKDSVQDNVVAKKDGEGEPDKPRDPSIKSYSRGVSPVNSEAELLPGAETDRESTVKARQRKGKRRTNKDTVAQPPEGSPGEREECRSCLIPLGSPASPGGDNTPFLSPVKLRDTAALDPEPEVVPSTSRRRVPGHWDGCSPRVATSHGNNMEAIAEPPFPVPL
ncbi:signal peptide peptidase-like 2A isoform X2 [Ornithodoros turicata]|uniref:signal peptide peptidase-like 2A isoform X2 n=1 Tax=Ornithodoros turicata TaxID=34597 RepID=UPI003139EB73